LVIAHPSPDTHLKNIYDSTCGIAFLGAPHHRSDLGLWAEKLATAINVFRQTNMHLVSLLKRDSEVLARIQSSFHSLVRGRGLNITCFYEELLTPRIGIVGEPAVIPIIYSKENQRLSLLTLPFFPVTTPSAFEAII
jgi:hypothetical protein